jgi:hypothetical protein
MRPVVSVASPAAARAMQLIERQREVATELDAALRQCAELRIRFELHAAELETFFSGLARGAGFDLSGCRYLGGERLRQWLRDRGVDPGFGALEGRHLETLKDGLDRVVEVVDAAR